jgi:glycosyltransferase involved in cell wall biosynthesis
MLPKVSERVHHRLMALCLPRLRDRLGTMAPFDLVNAHWLYPDCVAGARLASRMAVPLVASAHGCDANRDLGDPGKGPPILGALRQASSVVVVSTPLRERILSEGIPPEKVVVVPNGVDPSLFRGAAPGDGGGTVPPREEGTRRILFVGQLVEVKGIPTLLRALALLAGSGATDVRLHLVGEGPLRDSLEGLSEELAVSPFVRFEGQRPHGEVPGWMASSDLLVLPSAREGCPNVVLEALASGLPVVASRVGGIPDVVGTGQGILVPPGDPEALASALREALGRRWERDEVRGAVTGLTWDEAAGRYLDAYRYALRRGGK